MTYLDFVRLFSSPPTALLISAFVVSVFCFLFFLIGSVKSDGAASSYWKRLGLVAEVCVAVGLIGLATFAGRMKISADHQILEHRVRMAQAAVDEHLRVVIIENCVPLPAKRALAPFNPAVVKKELCTVARAYGSATGLAGERELAERSLRDFSKRYPGCIPNVFTSHSDCGAPVAEAGRLAGEIAALEASKRAARDDEAMAGLLESPNAWGFLLLAFVVAAIGVAIKCARAAAEVSESRR
ncbi:hypothetical protein Q4S45_07905 [Massilia sp. R2A-15]|uniref:hypothetical protein n=1 Tax=Massilia sp. R2A-15 TaxID=3064278 RepID=UPI002733418A|nr:hypothetical protein [Massilia sp. R2A-15]WLI91031.1 hypothetical protein Q4S45_07905 [Massilia sp. R2A-15]